MGERDGYLAKHPRERRAMLDRALSVHGWVCCICAGPIAPGTESLQHVRSRSKGGSDDESNLRPAHRRCNSALGDRDLDSRLVVFGGELQLLEWLGSSSR